MARWLIRDTPSVDTEQALYDAQQRRNFHILTLNEVGRFRTQSLLLIGRAHDIQPRWAKSCSTVMDMRIRPEEWRMLCLNAHAQATGAYRDAT